MKSVANSAPECALFPFSLPRFCPAQRKKAPIERSGSFYEERSARAAAFLLHILNRSLRCHRYIAPIISYPHAHIQVRPLVDSPAGRKAVDILLCIQMKLMLGGRRIPMARASGSNDCNISSFFIIQLSGSRSFPLTSCAFSALFLSRCSIASWFHTFPHLRLSEATQNPCPLCRLSPYRGTR